MSDEPDIETLTKFHEAMMESCRLVGKFMLEWAYVEASLDDAMGAALGLKFLQTAILSPTISLHAKVDITLAALQLINLPVPRAKRYRTVLNKLKDMANNQRNMLAHYGFSPNS